MDYLAATDPDNADQSLVALIEHEVRPLVARIVRQKAGATSIAGPSDIEDICADCTTGVLERLTDLRAGRDAEPIGSFSSYVAVAAFNGWHRYLRERFPVRSRLKNRLRYLCGHHPALAVWTDASGAAVCGLVEWRGKQRRENTATRVSAGIPHDAVRRLLGNAGGKRELSEMEAAPAILRWAGGPLLLDELAELVGPLVGLVDQPTLRPRSVEGATSIPVEIADSAPSALTVLTDREELQHLWSEIEQLPVRQRHALLLNLRDADGQGIIFMLPLTGLATIHAIAAVLEMPAAELAALWRALPLEDTAIASRLGITRQQVINLRKSARARLGRRLNDLSGERGHTAAASAS
jgi:DNA-directed RNA polymerase specialized sigma24 family protein